MGKKVEKTITIVLFVVSTLFLILALFTPKGYENSFTAFFIFSAGTLLLHMAHVRTRQEYEREVATHQDIHDHFVAMASEALHAPVAHIRGYTELLREKESELDEDVRKYVQRIDAPAQTIYTLVREMLHATTLKHRNKATHVHADFDIGEVVDDLIRTWKPIAESKGLRLKKDGLKEITVTSDKHKVRHVLSNLIAKAIHRTEKGAVTVRYKGEGDLLKIVVSDSGHGLGHDDKERLLKPFQRIKSFEKDKVEHSGLGLWLSHAIIRELQGSLDIESQKGAGTHIAITLPVVRPE